MRRPNAFTLIEMMAAALILALVVSWLTGAVGQMNRFEGDARRRAEASLFADRLLAGLEENAARGAALELGKTEAEEGAFTAEIEVTPFDPALLPSTLALGADAGAEGGSDPEASGGWLSGPAAEANPPVVRATVRVVGKDGIFDAGVSRTTFFLNPAALEALADETGGAEADQ